MKADEYLGIEGGGTRTVALVSDEGGRLLRRAEFGPGNVRLLADQELIELFSHIASICPAPRALGAGMAGARDEADTARARRAIGTVWENTPARVTHDLEVALAAAEDLPGAAAKILVLSGTGSCCYGRGTGRLAKVGGWGHLLGDRGSGYDLALSALREVVYQYDRTAKWGELGRRILERLALNEPNELIAWIQDAPKAEVAALAPWVFAARTDPVAKAVLRRAAESLARDAVICAARLARKNQTVAFHLNGSVLLQQPAFARKVAALIRQSWSRAAVAPLAREGAWGAVALARNAAAPAPRHRKAARQTASAHYYPRFVPESSPTEQRNPASTRFHELSTGKMIDVMLDAEERVIPALRKERAKIARAVEMAAETLQRGGRVFYVGAGTSGRLGVLDASECPPTFRVPPDMFQGIIAGGARALWQAVEGAEDDAHVGASALRFRRLAPRDLVIGIAASGRTPFVWGALGLARKIGAKTILLCFNPSLRIDAKERPDLFLAPNLGPEILTGSTRLKCGTATKLVLNTISTIALVRMGKVIGNLMVDLNPSNVKLRDRAVRIVRELTGCTTTQARAALEENRWVVKDAWAALKESRGPV